MRGNISMTLHIFRASNISYSWFLFKFIHECIIKTQRRRKVSRLLNVPKCFQSILELRLCNLSILWVLSLLSSKHEIDLCSQFFVAYMSMAFSLKCILQTHIIIERGFCKNSFAVNGINCFIPGTCIL